MVPSESPEIEKRTASQALSFGRRGQDFAYPRLQHSNSFGSSCACSCPGAEHTPRQLAPRGKRAGYGNAISSARSIGIKKGQAKSVPQRFPDSTQGFASGQSCTIVENKEMDRVAMLNEILTQDPNNAFARYGLALEYSNSGKLEQALEQFQKLLSANPDYAAGYFMAAQTLMKSDRRAEAREMLENGILAAQRKGDAHAASEMQGMLAEIGS